MRFLKKIAIFLLVYIGTASADSCDAILDEKLMTASSIVDQNEAESAAKYAFCNKTYSEVKKSTSGSVGGSYKFFSAGASKDESSFNKWKQSNCGDSASSSATARYRFSAQKALGEGVVEAWRDCMLKKEGLSCLIAPGSDNETIKFIYSWRPRGSGKNIMLDSMIYNGSRVNGGDASNKVSADGATVYPGRRNITVIRDDVRKKTIIGINTLYNEDIADECNVEVPADSPEQKGREVVVKTIEGRWCYSSASGPFSNGIPPSPSIEYVKIDDGWRVYLSPNQGARIPYGGVANINIEENGSEVTVTEVSRDMMLPPSQPPSLYFRGPFPAPDAPVTPSRPIDGVIPAPGNEKLAGTTAGSSEGLIVTTAVRYEMPDDRTLQAKSVSVTTNSSGDRDAGDGYPLIRYSRCD